MLDIRTLLVVMITTDLLLAGSLWMTLHSRHREGVGKWTISLAVQSLAFALLAGRGALPDALSIVVANALLAVAIVFQAAAIVEFNHRRLAVWAPYAAAGLVGALWIVLLPMSYRVRAIAAGLVFGTGMLAIVILIDQLRLVLSTQTRWIMIGGFIAGAFSFYARAIAAWLSPEMISGLLAPSLFQSVIFIWAFAAIVVTSFGFLLMHTERAEAQSNRLAITDPLTGTLNRRIFVELAERELAICRLENASFSLMMLDLDLFKHVNDNYGHQSGDAVLKRFAEIVQECLRKEDLLVRYGGEEFCVLLPRVSAERAQVLAERVRARVAHSVFNITRQSIRITTSIGISWIERGEKGSVDEILARADEALYLAKESGRNRVIALPLTTSHTAALLNVLKRER